MKTSWLDPIRQLLAARRHAWALPLLAPGLAAANPTGAEVASGAVAISNPDANTLQLDQSTASAAINWQSFSIGGGEFVVFNQPSASAVVLNRVVGGSPSEIFGHLLANGRVFLINPQGILFAPGAHVDVGALVASTLDLADEDFAAGRYVFTGAGSAAVTNAGNIAAAESGFVVLAGDFVNNTGVIQATLGTVVLASGSALTLSLDPTGLVQYSIDSAALSDRAGVENLGEILADGGQVVMTAEVARELRGTVVNNAGLVRAQSIEQNEAGEIYLLGEGGDVVNSGTLDVSGTSGQDGGTITVVGNQAVKLTPTSNINAAGDGVLARGGNVHVSGHGVTVRGLVSAGPGGTFLLDPVDIVIADGTGASSSTAGTQTVFEQFIEGQLRTGTDVILAATRSITLQDLTDNALTGTDAVGGRADDGSLTLGIGSTSGGIFSRGTGQPGGGINFLDANDSLIVGRRLQLSAGSGAGNGGINVGDLDAGSDMLLEAADPIVAGDLNAGGVAGISIGGLGSIQTGNLTAPNGPVQVISQNSNILISGNVIGQHVVSAEMLPGVGLNAFAGSIQVSGNVIAGSVADILANGDVIIGGNVSAVAGLNPAHNASAVVQSFNGAVTVNGIGGITVSAPTGGDAFLNLNAFTGVNVSGAVTVSGNGQLARMVVGVGFGGLGGGASFDNIVSVTGLGTARAELDISATGFVFVRDSVLVSGQGQGYFQGTSDGVPVPPAATASIVSRANGVRIGAAGVPNPEAVLTVTGTNGLARLNLESGAFGGTGGVTVNGDVVVTGGGGAGDVVFIPDGAVADIRALNGDVFTEDILVTAVAATLSGQDTTSFYGGSSSTHTFAGTGANAFLTVQASRNINAGGVTVNARGDAGVSILGGSDSITVRAPINVTATAATIDDTSAFTGPTFSSSSRTQGTAGNASLGVFGASSQDVVLDDIIINGPRADVNIQGGEIRIDSGVAPVGVAVRADGTFNLHVTGTSNGMPVPEGDSTGFADVFIGAGAGSAGVASVVINGGTSVTGGADASAFLSVSGPYDLVLNGDVVVAGSRSFARGGGQAQAQIGFGAPPAAQADLFSQYGGIAIGDATDGADISVMGQNGFGGLFVQAGSLSGDVAVYGDISVVGGGGADSSFGIDLVAVADIQANGGSVTITGATRVLGNAMSFAETVADSVPSGSDTVTQTGTRSSQGGGAALLIGAAQDAALGTLEVLGAGQAGVMVFAGNTLTVSGATLVNAMDATQFSDITTTRTGPNPTTTSQSRSQQITGDAQVTFLGASSSFGSPNPASVISAGPIRVNGRNADVSVRGGEINLIDPTAEGRAIVATAGGTFFSNFNATDGVGSSFQGISGAAAINVEGVGSASPNAVQMLGGLFASGPNASITLTSPNGVTVAGNVDAFAFAGGSESGSVNFNFNTPTVDVVGALTAGAANSVFISNSGTASAVFVTLFAGTTVTAFNGTLRGGAVAMAAGTMIDFSAATLSVGQLPTFFGSDPLLEVFLRIAAPDIPPFLLQPNGAFSAPVINIGNLELDGFHLFFHTNDLTLGAVNDFGDTNVLVRYEAFTPDAAIVLTDAALTAAECGTTALCLSDAQHFSKFTGTTHVIGGTFAFNVVAIGVDGQPLDVLPKDTNFIFLTNSFVFGLDNIFTNGTVIHIRPLIFFALQPVFEQFLPSKETEEEEEEDPAREDETLGTGADDEGTVEDQTGSDVQLECT